MANDTVMYEIDILFSFTGNFKSMTFDHKKRLKNKAFAGIAGLFDNESDTSGSGAVYVSKSSSANSLVELSMPGRETWNPQRHSGHATTGGLSIERMEEIFTSPCIMLVGSWIICGVLHELSAM